MTNLINKIKRWKMDLLYIGLGAGTVYLSIFSPLIYEKIENSAYTKNLRKEVKERRDFQNKFLEASKNKTIIYTPISKTGPSVYIDLEGDGNQDGILTNYAGSTRGSYGIDVRPIKKTKRINKDL